MTTTQIEQIDYLNLMIDMSLDEAFSAAANGQPAVKSTYYFNQAEKFAIELGDILG